MEQFQVANEVNLVKNRLQVQIEVFLLYLVHNNPFEMVSLFVIHDQNKWHQI